MTARKTYGTAVEGSIARSVINDPERSGPSGPQRGVWSGAFAVAAALTAVAAIAGPPALGQEEVAKGFEERLDQLSEAAAEGPVRVIVRLDLGTQRFQAEGELSSPEAAAQRRGLREVQDQVLQRLGNAGVSNVKRYDTVPLLALTVSEVALARLAADPDVTDIQEDVADSPLLDSSIPVMDIDLAWGLGYTGSGQTVAILDTGVDNDHAFFGGRVVSEACYSDTSSSSTSVCPGGVEESTAPDSGENCDLSLAGCNHGTHVAGIAAGNGTSFDGVARDASIIAIQVFSNFGGSVRSWSSDQIKGLERVYALRNTYDIASVNMSLGGGLFPSHCDSDLRKLIVDNLASVGIATVIASGNDGSTGAISAPACISTAIAVGSTTDADSVSTFSNHASLVDLMAVGSSVNSSVPGGGFSNFNGTSMATPHVAGAWALLKEAGGTTVSEVELCLENTGVGVTRSDITQPRIDVDDAITYLFASACGAPPVTPANDLFANAIALTGFAGIVNGTTINSTGEAGEPNHAGVSDPLNSGWWRWTPSASGIAGLDTCGSDYDTTLAVYTGKAVNALTEVASNDDNGAEACDASGGLQSRVFFNAVANTTYQIAVDGWSGHTGNITLNYSQPPCETLFDAANPFTQSGFGQPYDVFTDELLLNAHCMVPDANLHVGRGDENQLIYKDGYELVNGQWQRFDFIGDVLLGGNWYRADASVERPWNATQQGQTNVYLAYVCTWTGSEWNCGCRDETCEQSFWQVQAYEAPSVNGSSALAARR